MTINIVSKLEDMERIFIVDFDKRNMKHITNLNKYFK
jgi:hypothetical protein